MLTHVLELQLVREGVVFERLLLGQTQRKVFIIHNTSLLPVKWRLEGVDALAPEFKVIPSSGEVPPRQETPVTVEFTALQKKDLSEKVTLQVSKLKPIPQQHNVYRAHCVEHVGTWSCCTMDQGQHLQGCSEPSFNRVALSHSDVRCHNKDPAGTLRADKSKACGPVLQSRHIKRADMHSIYLWSTT